MGHHREHRCKRCGGVAVEVASARGGEGVPPVGGVDLVEPVEQPTAGGDADTRRPALAPWRTGEGDVLQGTGTELARAVDQCAGVAAVADGERDTGCYESSWDERGWSGEEFGVFGGGFERGEAVIPTTTRRVRRDMRSIRPASRRGDVHAAAVRRCGCGGRGKTDHAAGPVRQEPGYAKPDRSGEAGHCDHGETPGCSGHGDLENLDPVGTICRIGPPGWSRVGGPGTAVTVEPMKKHTRRTTGTCEVEGTLHCHVRGFGFIQDITITDKRPHTIAIEDVFVPANKLHGLYDGDIVAAVVSDDEEHNLISIRTVKRTRDRLFGTVVSDGVIGVDPGVGVGTVVFKGNASIGDTIVVCDVDGEWVVAETHGSELEDESLRVRILERHMLPTAHTEITEREALRIAAGVSIGQGKLRRDLRDLPVITIDADKSKDLDDAVSAQIDSDGMVRVWVHIADVAEHVAEGCGVDLAAQRTPTSVYLPMGVRPMLPASLSEAALSLLPGVDRDVLTVEMRITPKGKVTGVDVYESVIRSRQRLSYTTVAACLRGDFTDAGHVDGATRDLLGWLWHGASRLGIQRKRRGGVDGTRFNNDDGQDELDADAHLLIERLMVAANEAVATWLEARGCPAIYRCHGGPESASLRELEQSAAAFGYNVAFEDTCTPVAFAAFCDQIQHSVHADALWDVIGGCLERATYTTENIGHFGLGSDKYLHFTSPLRRYADLVVHRVVKQYLHGQRPGAELRGTLETLAKHITEISDRASGAERDATNAVALRDLAQRSKRRGRGVVRSISATQIRVYSSELASMNGSVAVRKLTKRHSVDTVRREINAGDTTYTIGSEISVRAKRIDPIAGVLELQWLTDQGGKPTKPKVHGGSKHGDSKSGSKQGEQRGRNRRRSRGGRGGRDKSRRSGDMTSAAA